MNYNVAVLNLWDVIPGTANTKPYLMYYKPESKVTNGAVLIVPGSGYAVSPSKSPQEGDRVARYLCEKGITVFVLEYRVAPDVYPLPLLDGRRAMRYIRHRSNEFGIDKNKICAMGYSAGGHLTASLTSYLETFDYEGEDDIDKESFIPNLQVLCYPVISMDLGLYYTHKGSSKYLLDGRYEEFKDDLSFENSQVENIPPTFIWHNFDDSCVNVVNSLRYAENLRRNGVSVEMHIFPDGGHGIGLPIEDRKDLNHNRKWIELLSHWLEYNDFFHEQIVAEQTRGF